MGLNSKTLPAHVEDAINRAKPHQLATLLEVGRGKLFDTRKPGKAGANRRRGQTAQRKGKTFQKIIAASSGRGQVNVAELPKCGGFFLGKGQFINQKIPCDFIGCIRSPRAAVFFDAKSFGPAQTVFPLSDPKLVKPHQLQFLRAMAEWGAVAGFLVECRRLRKYLWLPANRLDRILPIDWLDPRWVELGSMGELVNLDALAGEVPVE